MAAATATVERDLPLSPPPLIPFNALKKEELSHNNNTATSLTLRTLSHALCLYGHVTDIVVRKQVDDAAKSFNIFQIKSLLLQHFKRDPNEVIHAAACSVLLGPRTFEARMSRQDYQKISPHLRCYCREVPVKRDCRGKSKKKKTIVTRPTTTAATTFCLHHYDLQGLVLTPGVEKEQEEETDKQQQQCMVAIRINCLIDVASTVNYREYFFHHILDDASYSQYYVWCIPATMYNCDDCAKLDYACIGRFLSFIGNITPIMFAMTTLQLRMNNNNNNKRYNAANDDVIVLDRRFKCLCGGCCTTVYSCTSTATTLSSIKDKKKNLELWTLAIQSYLWYWFHLITGVIAPIQIFTPLWSLPSPQQHQPSSDQSPLVVEMPMSTTLPILLKMVHATQVFKDLIRTQSRDRHFTVTGGGSSKSSRQHHNEDDDDGIDTDEDDDYCAYNDSAGTDGNNNNGCTSKAMTTAPMLWGLHNSADLFRVVSVAKKSDIPLIRAGGTGKRSQRTMVAYALNDGSVECCIRCTETIANRKNTAMWLYIETESEVVMQCLLAYAMGGRFVTISTFIPPSTSPSTLQQHTKSLAIEEKCDYNRQRCLEKQLEAFYRASLYDKDGDRKKLQTLPHYNWCKMRTTTTPKDEIISSHVVAANSKVDGVDSVAIFSNKVINVMTDRPQIYSHIHCHPREFIQGRWRTVDPVATYTNFIRSNPTLTTCPHNINFNGTARSWARVLAAFTTQAIVTVPHANPVKYLLPASGVNVNATMYCLGIENVKTVFDNLVSGRIKGARKLARFPAVELVMRLDANRDDALSSLSVPEKNVCPHNPESTTVYSAYIHGHLSINMQRNFARTLRHCEVKVLAALLDSGSGSGGGAIVDLIKNKMLVAFERRHNSHIPKPIRVFLECLFEVCRLYMTRAELQSLATRLPANLTWQL